MKDEIKEYFTYKNLEDMYDRTIKLLNDENKDTYGFEPAEIQLLIKEIKIYKSRIDKALEYIKWNLEANEELIEYFNFDANFNKLLDILKGDDKSE